MELVKEVRIFDGHWHGRDWEQRSKETIERSLMVAEAAGIIGIVAMPNTDPPLTTLELCQSYLSLADSVNLEREVEFYVHIGATPNPDQIKHVITAIRNDPQILALKCFFGKSTGSLTIENEDDQQKLWQTLAQEGYEGVVIGHCEDEQEMNDKLYKPKFPITWSLNCRPEKAEISSVKKNLRMAEEAGFKGTFHIAHVSTKEVAYLVANYKGPVKLSYEVSPQHIFLSDIFLSMFGAEYKCNPPIRNVGTQAALKKLFLEGKIPMMQSDNAPHTADDKNGNMPASGICSGPFWPEHVSYLAHKGRMPAEAIDQAVFVNPVKLYGLDHLLDEKPREVKWDRLRKLQKEYHFNPFKNLFGGV